MGSDSSVTTSPSKPVETQVVADVSTVAGAAEEDGLKPAVGQDASETAGATTVLVVGGRRSEDSVAVVSALVSGGRRVIAVEHDPYAAALRLAELGSLIPPPEDLRFAHALGAVARASGATAVLAPGSEEMKAIAEASPMLRDIGVQTWSPGPDVFASAPTEPALHAALDSSGLTVEKTGIGPTAQSNGRGRQFNVDVLVDRDHEVIAAVSSWRLAKDGDRTMAAETFFDPRLLELIRAICATILIEGPVVIEGYVSEIGRALLLGVRPGFSPCSPSPVRQASTWSDSPSTGHSVAGTPTRLLAHRPGVRMVRYLDQVFEG